MNWSKTLCVLACVIPSVCLVTVTEYIRILIRDAEYTSIPASDTKQSVCISICVLYCYDLEGTSSKLIMLDSECWAPPVDGAPPLCDIEDEEVEVREVPTGAPAGLGTGEGSRPPGRSGCVSVLTSSSSSSSSSSMLGQADWSSTRFRRSFRALRASCLEGRGNERCSSLIPEESTAVLS